MEMCEVCDNYMYCKLDESGVLFVCRNCGNQSTKDSGKTKLIHNRVFKRDLSTDAKKQNLLSNPFLADDQTLPRKQLKCFNETCKNTEMVVVRLDAENANFMCICPVCKTTWSGANEL
jgi:DNA-directed RNA polymerase subunit M/transcription elongation factor TFIIS